MMKTNKNGQKLRLKVIEQLKHNEQFGGSDPCYVTIGRIMGVMEIEEIEVEAAVNADTLRNVDPTDAEGEP